MNALLLAAAATVGAIQPVSFESRGYDEIILESGETLRGTVHSSPGATTIRIQLLSQIGVRAFPRNLVREIRNKQTLAEAHDGVAKGIDDGDADSWHGLALTCLKKRPPLLDRAEADLRKAVSARPTYGPSRVLLAEVLARRRKYAEARTVAEEALEYAKGDAAVHIAYGKILLALGEDARDALSRALAIEESQEALLVLAEAELAVGRYTEAEAAVVEAGRLARKTPELTIVHGDILLARGELDPAEKLYAQAAQTGGYDVDGARRGLAAVKYLRGQYEEADAVLLQADQSDPYACYLQGLTKLARGSEYFAEATKQFTAAAGGNVGRAQIGLGTFLYHDLGGDLKAASAKFRKAVEQSPADPYARLMSAWCSFKVGNYDEAAREGAAAAKLAPRSPEAHAASGASALMSGSYAEAVRRYRNGLEACPDDGMLLAGLGIAQLTGGDRLAAAESLSNALSAGYRGPDVFMGQGYLSFLKTDYERAAEFFTCAISASSGGDTDVVAYAADAITRLYAGKGLQARIGTFDAKEIAEPFRIREARGVSIVSQDGRLVIAGMLEDPPRGRVGLEMPVDGGLFKSFAADVILEPDGKLVAGVFLESRNGGVEVARVPSMGAAFRVRDGKGKDWGQWRVLTPWRSDGTMRLSVEMVETGKDLAVMEIRASTPTPASPQDVARGRAEFKESIGRERSLAAGIFVAASPEQDVEARADNIIVVENSESTR